MSPQEQLDALYASQRKNQPSVSASTVQERRVKLHRLEKLILASRARIAAAIAADYAKSPMEVDLSEIYPALTEARHARKHLAKWMKPKRVAPTLTLLGTRSEIVPEPKGVVLIISPWNFPFNLTIGPLVSAVAAGNCVIIKPSELTPNTSRCMRELLATIFPEEEVAVLEGGVETSTALLKKRFDHIFFTGSPGVGKIVMKAAAEYLCSVTLELGGKSPVIVGRTADLEDAAQKIAWGKFLNNGQVCIAPDYLLLDSAVREPFLEKLRLAVDNLFGTEAGRVGNSDYGRIVNDHHFKRVDQLIESAIEGGAAPLLARTSDATQRFISPTILTGVAADAAVLRDEIFGPVLPIVDFTMIDEALEAIRDREKPLVLYLFSRDEREIAKVMSETSAGGTCINDTLIHFFHPNLPFGGAGFSGLGRSHGYYGFEAFSNMRAVLRQRTGFTLAKLLYPPYTAFRRKLIDLTVRYF
ncbi:MAG TPA: aldehyde dehydrogenase family protein [Thermoanaerobaculia bacterium]|nr:aldehyde dehydrogenase family protein [Thermoanaerobaculia bacterium]